MLGAGALLLLNPLLIGKLPFIAIISTETVVISLFLPISVLLGGGAVWLWEYVVQRSKNQEPRTENQLPPIGSWVAQGAPGLGSRHDIMHGRSLFLMRVVWASLLVSLAVW